MYMYDQVQASMYWYVLVCTDICLPVTVVRSFILILSRNNRTEFGGPKGLEQNTKRNAVALAHTKHTTQTHKRMRETLRLAVKSMKVSRQSTRRGEVLHGKKTTRIQIHSAR